jgi:UPF0755 protein
VGETPRGAMKPLLSLLAKSLLAAVILVGAVAGGGYWVYREAAAPGPSAEAHPIVIPPRAGVSGIAERLEQDGVIRNKFVFEVAAKFSGHGGALQSGEYEFPAQTSMFDAMDLLASGKTVKHRVTIPEGLTSDEVAALVNAAPALAGENTSAPPEGSVLPETYIYSYGEQRQELIGRMQRAMTQAVAQAWNDRRDDLYLTDPKQALILASIVEKESAKEDEREHIAGVFINRLRLGMPLQSDPTVIYAIEGDKSHKLDRPLTHADLSVASPYNTYVEKGLPPGPIDNPGKSSLRAATRPQHTDDLYFVADGKGGHVFAQTLAEHDRNVALYRQQLLGASPPEPPGPAVAQAAPVPPEKPHAPVHEHCRHVAGHPCPR